MGQKDVRDTRPILGRLLNCQNMTMARFADMLQAIGARLYSCAGSGRHRARRLVGFHSQLQRAGQLKSGGQAPSAESVNEASDPNGALSLPDAIAKQLGLKLEQTKRPVKVLVIDHIEPKPTEN